MKFGTYEAKQRELDFGGESYLVALANGYDASIVRHSFSHGGKQGLWELAIMHDGDIDYTTPITEDVLGWLTDEDVVEMLDRIAALPDLPI